MSTNDSEKLNKLDPQAKWAFILLIIGILCIFFPFDILHNRTIFGLRIDTADYDKLGNFINGVTSPFFSISAFILLFLTYRSQTIELQQTRLILTKQSETYKKEQFESTFFNLLNLHHQIVNSIDLRRKLTTKIKGVSNVNPYTVYGRDCFVTFYSGFKTAYSRSYVDDLDQNIPQNDLAVIKSSYKEFYTLHQADLGHYFRNLYHIIKLIDKSDINNKKEYTSLVRAQLSSHEQLLLFYNCLSDYGVKFKPLIEKYSLFKNMPLEELIFDRHQEHYALLAFGKLT